MQNLEILNQKIGLFSTRFDNEVKKLTKLAIIKGIILAGFIVTLFIFGHNFVADVILIIGIMLEAKPLLGIALSKFEFNRLNKVKSMLNNPDTEVDGYIMAEKIEYLNPKPEEDD